MLCRHQFFLRSDGDAHHNERLGSQPARCVLAGEDLWIRRLRWYHVVSQISWRAEIFMACGNIQNSSFVCGSGVTYGNTCIAEAHKEQRNENLSFESGNILPPLAQRIAVIGPAQRMAKVSER
eukprot:Selendium_serpulae@DN6182_c2_g3_i1.p1